MNVKLIYLSLFEGSGFCFRGARSPDVALIFVDRFWIVWGAIVL